MDRAEERAQRRRELRDQRQAIEAEFGTADMHFTVRDLIWEFAWEHGHACGMHEVKMFYGDMAKIAEAADLAATARQGGEQ